MVGSEMRDETRASRLASGPPTMAALASEGLASSAAAAKGRRRREVVGTTGEQGAGLMRPERYRLWPSGTSPCETA